MEHHAGSLARKAGPDTLSGTQMLPPARNGGPLAVPGTARPPARVQPRRRPRRALRDVVLAACYLAAGAAVTWPRITYLAGELPAMRDTGGYVWGFWWVARQVIHLSNPWITHYLAAPVGTQLAYHTLMPLPGLVMTPVTLVFGPSASYNLLAAVAPGLLGYAMYRAARLWLPSVFDSAVAGALFGLSSSLAWRSWYELNLALGAVFLPMALGAAVRLRREPTPWRATALGLVLGAALLTDQESAVLAGIVAGLVLLPWLWWPPAAPAALRLSCWLSRVRLTALAVLMAGVSASPQIIAMVQQTLSGGATTPAHVLAEDYSGSGAGLVQMFAPSPRLMGYGLASLAAPYYQGRPSLVEVGYGATLALLALSGLVVAWRRPSTRLLGAAWAGATLLALGTQPWLYNRSYVPFSQIWHGVRVSLLMPYTWFVRLPGLANFREADRFTEIGLLCAALLAGSAAGWLRTHSRPVLAVALALAALEAGWSGNPHGREYIGVMPTALPRLDGPIAADHSNSVVVDVPFGIRGGLPVTGDGFPPETMILATADGHPLGDAYVSRIPHATLAGVRHKPFYRGLMTAQGGPSTNTPADLAAARVSARVMNVGWVIVWTHNTAVTRFLAATGFHPGYRANGATVYQRSSATSRRRP